MYTGAGVRFSGKSHLNGFLICFALTAEAEEAALLVATYH